MKIGAKVVRHGRNVIFQMAEVAVPRELFQDILRVIAKLRTCWVGSITVLEHEQQLVLGAIERPHAGIVLGPHDQVLGNQALLAACACQFEQVPPVHEHEQDGAVPRMCLRAAEECRQERGEFDFLGFTHFCTRSRKWGSFVIGRKTIKKRMRAKLLAIKIELRRLMHDPIAKTGAWVKQMLKGHLNYFAVSGNHPSLWWFFNKVKRLWLASLKRRSQTARLSWERFIRFVARFFPPIRTIHPLPCHRFDAKTRGRSPVR